MAWKLLKISATILVISLIIISIADLYFFRERKIDFTQVLPSQLELCGKTISKNDPEYSALHNWLKQNQKPWKNNLVSYVPNYIYSGQGFNINVFPTSAVVNAQLDGSNLQVVIVADTKGIYGTCTNNS